VAVLPFENLGSAEDDYFADGIADAVRGKLTSVRGLEVIARGSSIPYKKTTKPPKQIAEELDAPYLLTATVRWQKSGGTSRVQVSPELVEIKASGVPTSKWQQPFDAALTDIFQVQADIATRVSRALGAAMGAGDEQRLAERPTKNLAAYDAFLRGQESLKDPGAGWTPAYRKSLGFYEQAVALDPQFAQAWAGLSAACSWVYGQFPTPQLAERARTAADKVLALAPDAPEAYLAEGLYRHFVIGDRSGALERFSKGHRLAPGNSDLLVNMGVAEAALGRRAEAIDHYRLAERLDPRSTDPKLFLGAVLCDLGRFAEAREVFDRALALAPSNLTLIQWKAQMRLVDGDLPGARAVLEAIPKEVEPTELVAYMATYGDFGWVLNESQRELLLRLTPSAFDDDRANWALCLTQAYAWKRDLAGC
jgi:TolB-like protein